MTLDPESVAANRLDMQPTGESYVELATTGAIVAVSTPFERWEVAQMLRGLLARPPLAAHPKYAPHRNILGALLYELETFALRADDPQPEDLRDPGVVAREHAAERAFRDWQAIEKPKRAAAYHDYVTTLLDNP